MAQDQPSPIEAAQASKTSTDSMAVAAKKTTKTKRVKIRAPDRAGLSPIHWASIYNRSDLIEELLDRGSPVRERCRNRLLANGTPLHLAAMNGSIETASVLLNRCESAGDWLRERDADGQTALMRCAAPRTKRMDTVRDLLRKNLWSLSGRPAEIALYLINRGADWRETDSIEGMNLMHLAIINDYEDIVCMLLVIDKKLASVPVQLRKAPQREKPKPTKPASSSPAQKVSTEVGGAENAELETIDLESSPASSSPLASDDSGQEDDSAARQLIDKKARTRQLVGKSMLPLQLAIIHGRVNMIKLLWSAQDTERTRDDDDDDEAADADSKTKQRLQSIVFRVFWSNKHQIAQFARSVCLKYALALDLTLITLVWMPVYLDNDEDLLSITIRNGLFVLSYFTTMALAFRVMMTRPGYLRRNEGKYFDEMKSLARVAVEQKQTDKQSSNSTGVRAADKSSSAKSEGEPAPKVEDIAQRVRLMCHKCHCIRRPRSRHCNYCNHCVQDFDHHCIYLGCCIGRKNRLDFLLMIISLTLMAIYGSFIQMNSIETGSWHRGWHLVGFLWIFKYVLIGGATSFFILKRASHGVTMYEEIRSSRIRKIFGSRGPPPETSNKSKSLKYFATLKGSFWRYAPNRFLTGDLPARKIIDNLREYANYSSIWNYLLSVTCADTLLARTITTISSERNKAYNIP